MSLGDTFVFSALVNKKPLSSKAGSSHEAKVSLVWFCCCCFFFYVYCLLMFVPLFSSAVVVVLIQQEGV